MSFAITLLVNTIKFWERGPKAARTQLRDLTPSAACTGFLKEKKPVCSRGRTEQSLALRWLAPSRSCSQEQEQGVTYTIGLKSSELHSDASAAFSALLITL